MEYRRLQAGEGLLALLEVYTSGARQQLLGVVAKRTEDAHLWWVVAPTTAPAGPYLRRHTAAESLLAHRRGLRLAQPSRTTYIGDGVYAEHTGDSVAVYTSNGVEKGPPIYLERQHILSLLAFDESVRSAVRAGTARDPGVSCDS